jgi:hypothetical protein
MQQRKHRRRAGDREDDRGDHDQAIEVAGMTHEVLSRGKYTATRNPVPHSRPQRETQRPAMSQVKLAGYRDASNINDVAYEVARIRQALKSPGPSIGPMSANAALVVEHGSRTQTLNINSASGEASATTTHAAALADRIHALQR